MMNAPTNTAMNPNASSAGVRNPLMASFTALAESFASCVPVFTRMPGRPTSDRTFPASCAWLTPGFAATSIAVTLPAAPDQRWTSASRASVSMAPPTDAGNLAIPLTVTACVPVAVADARAARDGRGPGRPGPGRP